MSDDKGFINFKDDTLKTLNYYKKSKDDVVFVTDGQKYCTFDDFLKNIGNYKYDDNWCGPYINLNLKIVGYNWWLERHEYDGSECWKFKTTPTQPEIECSSIKWKCNWNFN